MSEDYLKYEGYIHSNDSPYWNHSYYYNAYDPASRTGALVRVGLLENRNEANSWFIAFQDGSPLFARTNLNLPYTPQRPVQGLELAGMRIHAEVPLKKTRISFCAPDFSAELVWDELHPMENCIAMSEDQDGAFERDLSHVHLEGTSTVTGHFFHRGRRMVLDGKGFRDISTGPRNWDALRHYCLAWPIFDDGTAFSGIHGVSTAGGSSYMRMFHDGEQWRRVKQIDDTMVFAEDGLSVTSAHWCFVDELDRRFELTGTPLFKWTFPFDTFVLCEQIMEFRLADGTLGYGLYETGYRLPWSGRD